MYFPSRMAVPSVGSGDGPSLEDYLCGNVSAVTIPKQMRSLSKYLFCGCSSLEKVTFHDKVTAIGDSCFQDCSNLTKIENIETVKQYGSNALRGTGFTEFVLPEGVTSIGAYLFGYCYKLKRAVIPSTVTSIPSDLFESCSALTDAVINAKATLIQSYTFYGCSALQNLTLPDTLKTINGYSFYYCGIAQLTLPASLETICANAFYGTSKLASVTFENPEGWVLATSSSAASGDPIDLSDPAQNATYLKSTYTGKYFRRLS